MPPFTISTTGTSSIIHKAERAIMTLTITDSASSASAASASVNKAASLVRSILVEKAPKDDAGVQNHQSGIAHWKTYTLTTTSSEHTRSGSSMKKHFRASTGFEIKFRDFALLGSWTERLGAVPNCTIDSLGWALSDGTKQRLRAEGRRLSAEDAMSKAGDYAEAFGVSRKEVKVVEITDVDEKGSIYVGYSGANGYSVSKWEGGVEKAWENEEILIQSTVNVKFVVDLV